MIHMLSSFNLRPNEDFNDFSRAYAAFIADLEKAGIITGAGPLAKRVADTPMDTDDARDFTYFSLMSFRNRAHLDAAYAYIEAMSEPGSDSHLNMYRRISTSVFTCWQDLG